MISPSKNIWQKIVNSHLLDEEDTAIIYYSLPLLKEQLNYLTDCFGNSTKILHTIAIKTNPHPAILRFISEQGFGLEAASYEEVLLALKADVAPEKISYNSPVKTQREINLCIQRHQGIHINVNSFEELERIPKNAPVKIGLRVNPCIDLSTNNLYNVSKRNSKFGIPIFEEERILAAAKEYNISSFHIHVGSQAENIEEMVKAIQIIYELAERTNHSVGYQKISHINIGGGLSSGKTLEENRKNMSKYAETIFRKNAELIKKYNLITEFGQWVHRLNGICFSRIEYVKDIEGENSIAYIHLGGDLFPREIYTDINHFSYEVIQKDKGEKTLMYDIAGPLCFNGDYIVKNIYLPQLKEGDVFAIKNTGANTYGLWSRHCSRKIPKVVSLTPEGEIQILSNRGTI